MPRKSTKFNPKEWAKTQKRRVSGVRCVTCSHKEIAAAIRAVLETIAARQSDVSIKQIHEMIVEQFNYGSSERTLYGHIRRCEAVLWDQCRG